MTLRTDDPAVAAWRRLLQYQRRTMAALDAALSVERDLSLEEYDVLYQLSALGGWVRMTDIAAAVLVARSSCTRLVDRLERRGWVVRRPGDVDRRSVEVALTDAGRAALRRAAITHLRGIDEAFASRLSGRDLDDLVRILDHLQRVDHRDHVDG